MRGLQAKKNKSLNTMEDEETTYLGAMETIWVYLMFYLLAVLRDTMDKLRCLMWTVHDEEGRDGYIPLYCNFEKFYRRYCVSRMSQILNVPISTMAAPLTTIIEREKSGKLGELRVSGKQIQLINMTSYNYLDTNQNHGNRADRVKEEMRKRGVTTGSSRCELGALDTHGELESQMSEFLGVEDVFTVGMGFATNSTIIPCLVDHESLILSDEKNHASIVLGCRLSGAAIRVYKHNDMEDLEENIRTAILRGNRKTHRAFKKILIIAEGIYSMEGTIVELRDMIRLKKKYHCYLFLDEAHSIGALGKHGKGVCDFFGCNPRDIDLMMGTFTKSFSANGGYVAGNRSIIDYIRSRTASCIYATAMPPPIARQIILVLNLLKTTEGVKKVDQLAQNVKYFRSRLTKLGFRIIGHEASPVVPLMLSNPSIGFYTVKTLQEQGVGCPYVGFPATELMKGRLRFCLSAGHTRKMLDHVIDILIWIDAKAAIAKKVAKKC